MGIFRRRDRYDPRAEAPIGIRHYVVVAATVAIGLGIGPARALFAAVVAPVTHGVATVLDILNPGDPVPQLESQAGSTGGLRLTKAGETALSAGSYEAALRNPTPIPARPTDPAPTAVEQIVVAPTGAGFDL